MISEARDYANRGLAVVPMHVEQDGTCSCRQGKDCPTPGKHPRIRWKEREAVPPAEQELQDWYRRWRDAPPGCILGDRLAAIDVDEREALSGLDSMHELEREHGELPQTWRQLTPAGGFQALFALNGHKLKPVHIAPNVELRTGRQILRLPPGSGRQWEIAPEECDLAPLPAWVAKLASQQHEAKASAPMTAPEEIPEGERYDTLKSLAASLRRKGLRHHEILAALTALNAQRCKPPKDPSVLEDLAQWADGLEGNSISPPNPKSTEHTEHSGANPHGERDRVFGLGGERSTEHAPNTLAQDERILDRHDELMAAQGLVGELHISRGTYLAHISRLTHDPAREVIKGDSSTGKSFAAECSLNAAAPEELYVRTGTSALALFYSEEDFRHRTLVFYEANKLGDDDDPLARVLRTLISEGRLAHEVTIVEKRTTALLEREGPIAFISTTCRPSLDKEIETRILSFHSDNSDEQTGKVVSAILTAATNPPEDPDLSGWHELDRWLAADGPYEVVVPWAAALAEFKLSGPPRLRRDITNLLALSKAHAVLHRATRAVDERGRIIATIDDYDVVRDILSIALAVATDKAVRKGTRKIVEAVAALRAEGVQRVSMRAASRRSGRSPSTTHSDVHDALERGYLINRSQRENQYDLEVGDELPAQEDLLPATKELARVFGLCSVECSVPDRTRKPASESQKPASVRTVRSNSDRAGEETLGAAWDRVERARAERANKEEGSA